MNASRTPSAATAAATEGSQPKGEAQPYGEKFKAAIQELVEERGMTEEQAERVLLDQKCDQCPCKMEGEQEEDCECPCHCSCCCTPYFHCTKKCECGCDCHEMPKTEGVYGKDSVKKKKGKKTETKAGSDAATSKSTGGQPSATAGIEPSSSRSRDSNARKPKSSSSQSGSSANFSQRPPGTVD